eukprot:jgi/Botrbrau1/22068/Bobra.0638s0001.1
MGAEALTLVEQSPRGWVQCDSCSKWRALPAELVKAIDVEKTTWFCEDNPDKQFASCDIPQEFSDDEIDRQLKPNDGEDGEDHPVGRPPKRRPVVWQLITENIYTHRQVKVQDEDDVMLCHCKPPNDGSPACGETCINRALNMECDGNFCPCGAACTNQEFTRRQYARLEVRRAGGKGFGLYCAEDIKRGQFIIEYMGEVLDEDEYSRRKEFYMERSQRHYYFMNVGNGEYIDALRKGHMGRFINHSCEPNCDTEKWIIKGELAIGLFAKKDIAAGEELTFDYNFERYGDKVREDPRNLTKL